MLGPGQPWGRCHPGELQVLTVLRGIPDVSRGTSQGPENNRSCNIHPLYLLIAPGVCVCSWRYQSVDVLGSSSQSSSHTAKVTRTCLNTCSVFMDREL